MPPPTTRLLAAAGLVLATLGAALATEGDAGESRADAQRTVSGTISAVVGPEAKLAIDAADGPVTLRIDRNTAVFLEDRLGSARDLVVGANVRASYGGDGRAAWVEVRPRAAGGAGRDGGVERSGGATRETGTATGPPVLPPAGAAAPDAGPATTAGADAGVRHGPGDVPAGPSPPGPNAGVRPPRPTAPRPTGPGPMPIGH